METLAAAIDRRVGALLHKCAVSQWEMRVRVEGGGGSSSGAWRVVVSNPTGVAALVEVSDTPSFILLPPPDSIALVVS